MAAHRYWRLAPRVSGSTSLCGITEIELRTSVSGADVTGSGTASASSERAGEEAAKAFDNLTTTQWQMNGGGAGAWIKYDFGAGNDKDIVEILIRPNKDDILRTPREIDVQYSDDNSTWTTLWRISYASWVAATNVTFAAPSVANHRYWRLRPDTLGAGDTMSCAEMEMRSTAGGSDQTGSGTASARTTFSTQVAANAFDNNSSTYWSGSSDAADCSWLAYDFGSGVNKDIQQISFQARGDGSFFNDQSPQAGWVESSTDGINWITRWTFSGLGTWTNGQTKVFGSSSATGRRRQLVN